MRIARVELATGNETVELHLHPRLTLVTGLGRLEREALAAEVLGAISSGRPGLSVDIVADDGRCLEVRRPLDGAASVTDSGSQHDLTDRFRDTRGGTTIDVLGALGVNRAAGHELLHVREQDLRGGTEPDDIVGRLAALDQDILWSTAIAVAELEVEMATLHEAANSDPYSAMADEIETVHAARDMAGDHLDTTRSQSRLGAPVVVLISIAAGLITHPLLALPFLAAAGALVARAWRAGQDYEAAEQAEHDVLDRAGISSYLNFQLKKVDELTSSSSNRSRTLETAELHRAARDRWELLAGKGVSLEWAAAHRPDISATADELRGGGGGNSGPFGTCDRLIDSFTAARQAVGEAIPVIIDDLFSTLDDDALATVLAALSTYSPHLQIIAMSNDERVHAWARRHVADERATVVHLGGPGAVRPSVADRTLPDVIDRDRPDSIVQPFEHVEARLHSRSAVRADAPPTPHLN